MKASPFLMAGLFAGLLVCHAAALERREPIKAFCIDFNWGEGGVNGFARPGLWANASPEEHVAWYEGLGANVIQTFAVSCNGFAWYKGGVVPEQPGLKYDFLRDVVGLGHRKQMRVMGYFCVGANTRWGKENPELSYGTPSDYHIPFTTEYLDFLCASIEDALTKTGMDGFMIDWVWNPKPETRGRRWLECEKRLHQDLMQKPFPGEERITEADEVAYGHRAIDRCWRRIHHTAKRAKPDCIIWLSCSNLEHPAVTNSKMFKEVDWLMNEATDPKSLESVGKMIGPHARLIQCLVGWGSRHDAKKVLTNPRYKGLNVYGFAKPRPNSLPLPIQEYRSNLIEKFEGNDKNIAVLARYYRGIPLTVTPPALNKADP